MVTCQMTVYDRLVLILTDMANLVCKMVETVSWKQRANTNEKLFSRTLSFGHTSVGIFLEIRFYC